MNSMDARSSRLSSRFQMGGALTVAVLTGSYTLLLYGTTVFLARALGTHQYGQYSVVIAVTSIVSVLATPGIDQLLTRDLAIYQAHDEYRFARGLLHACNNVVMVSSAVLTAGLCGIAWLFYRHSDGGLLTAMLLGSTIVPLSAIARTRAYATAGLGHVIWARLPDLAIRPLALAGICVVLFLTLPDFALEAAILATIAAWAASMSVSTTVLRGIVRRQLPEVDPATDPRRWIRASVPFLLFAITSIMYSQFGVIMVEALSTSTAAGLYAVSSRGAAIVALGFVGAAAASAPAAARLWSQGKSSELRDLIVRMSKFSFGFAAASCLVLVLIAPQILAIFGEDFVPAANAFRILCVGQLVFATTGIFSTVLLANGGEGIAAFAMGASFLVGLALCVLLIPRMGVVGAALAVSGSLILGQALTLIAFLRRWPLVHQQLGPAERRQHGPARPGLHKEEE